MASRAFRVMSPASKVERVGDHIVAQIPVRPGVTLEHRQCVCDDCTKIDLEGKKRVAEVSSAWVKSADFERLVREALVSRAKALVETLLDERAGELDLAVRAVVEARWEGDVEKAARTLLDSALAEVRAKIAGTR